MLLRVTRPVMVETTAGTQAAYLRYRRHDVRDRELEQARVRPVHSAIKPGSWAPRDRRVERQAD